MLFLNHFLQKAARLFPNKVALVEEHKRFTYREFEDRTCRLASALQELGIQPFDRVVVISHNCTEFAELYFAIPWIGAIIVVVNPYQTPEELSWLINDVGAKAVIVNRPYLEKIEKERVPSVKEFICIGESGQGMIAYEDLVGQTKRKQISEEKLHPEETAIIMYTSGTTGRPRGVMQSHLFYVWQTLTGIIERRLVPSDVYLNSLPLFHFADTEAFFQTVYLGGTNVFIPRFKPEDVLQAIQNERVTFTLLEPPYLIRRLVEHPESQNYDLSSFRLMLYAAGTLTIEQFLKAKALFRCEFSLAYGSTQAGIVSVLKPEDHKFDGLEEEKKIIYSIGQEARNVKLKIVDESGQELPFGRVGEIVVRTPCLMNGYWRQPEETKVVLRDGWYYTGDLAYLDENGYLYFSGRKADIIKTGGENVSAQEVENVIIRHQAVDEVAVVGIPDERWGEMVTAFVVPHLNVVVGEQEIIDFCKKQLAGYKVPKRVIFLDSLPKNTIGKVVKNQLKLMYNKQ